MPKAGRAPGLFPERSLASLGARASRLMLLASLTARGITPHQETKRHHAFSSSTGSRFTPLRVSFTESNSGIVCVAARLQPHPITPDQ